MAADKEIKVKVICSCPPGFEQIAVNECREKLFSDCDKELRGRISLTIPIKDLHRLSELRAINHCWVVVKEIKDYFKQDNSIENVQEDLCKLAFQFEWKNALQAWRTYKLFESTRNVNPSVEKKKLKKMEQETDCGVDSTSIKAKNMNYDIDPLVAENNLSFRVTTTRTGKHIFGSPFVDRHFGGGIQDCFNWKVDLSNFNIKIVAYVLDESISVGIQLTEDCQSLRNLTHFGPTNLRANIAYCLLKFAKINPGDIVCDPMCGGGSISLEGACGIPSTFHVAGDNHEKAVENARDNYIALARLKESELVSTIPVSVLRWDIYHLPLRTCSVDRIVTDLPFGKKIGNRDRNMFLYPNALHEMARICRPRGKAVLLTHHKKAFWKALMICKDFWKLEQCMKINMGGMNISVYLLGRSENVYTKREYPTTTATTTKKKHAKGNVPKNTAMESEIIKNDNQEEVSLDKHIKILSISSK